MDTRPIGVFDSGFGGLSVLAEATRLLPQEDFIYFGDNRNAPYGDKTQQEVLGHIHTVVERLIEENCQAILIACNTATSVAAGELRQELQLPIIGMEPALKPASLLPGDGVVLVMATAMTLRLEKFKRLMEQYGQNAIPVPCSGLVEYVESGEVDSPRVRALLTRLLEPYMRKPVKAVVMGCTHYVYLRRTLSQMLPPSIILMDGNVGTVLQHVHQRAHLDCFRSRTKDQHDFLHVST